jgi:hypothetical protein
LAMRSTTRRVHDSVLEIVPVRAALIHCLASPEALEAVGHAPGVLSVQIAPDEALAVAPGSVAVATLEQLIRAARVLDPLCILLDQSAGYAGFRLSGGNEAVAFARLSQLPLAERRPGFVQGLVAHTSAKVFATEGSIVIFVSSVVAHYIAKRISAACVDLGITWNPPADYVVPSMEGFHP